MISIINGGFQLPGGAPVAGGTLVLRLSNDSQAIGSTGAIGPTGASGATGSTGPIGPTGSVTVVAGIPIEFSLDLNGNVPAGSMIWSNVELEYPTYYWVSVYDSRGRPVLRYSMAWVFVLDTGSTQDLGSMVSAVIPGGE
jgi:hypothetical protein